MHRQASAADIAQPPLTLPAWGTRALSLQALLLISASFLLPAAAHLSGLPVRWLLPMHWPVLLVGLVYGWRSGLLVGLAAPGLSNLLSGMPLPVILPSMTVELAAYGLLAGLFRQTLRRGAFTSTAAALVGGRLVFVAIAVATGATKPTLPLYLQAALLPGIAAALAQLALLPLLASWWVRRGSAR